MLLLKLSLGFAIGPKLLSFGRQSIDNRKQLAEWRFCLQWCRPFARNFEAAQSGDKRTSRSNPAIDFQYATPQFDPIFSPGNGPKSGASRFRAIQPRYKANF